MAVIGSYILNACFLLIELFGKGEAVWPGWRRYVTEGGLSASLCLLPVDKM